MPYTPNNPATAKKATVVTEDVALDTIRITSFTVTVEPALSVAITVELGYMEGSAFKRLNVETFRLNDASVAVKIMEIVTPGDTTYGAVKSCLYELLQEHGMLPEGTIT